MLQSEWHGCYDDGWKGMIVDEAFAHPAKMAYGLLTRIVRRMVDEGWVEAGQVVGDPFGGIGTGGIVSAYYGLHWVGVELEPRFVELAGKNFDLHRPRWENLPGCVAPRIVNGDSRRFAGLVGEAAAVVTSPPYAEAIKNEQNDSDVLSAKEASGEIDQSSFRSPGPYSQCRQKRSYGTTPGQIGALKEGTLAGVVTSPPWTECGKTLNVEGKCRQVTTERSRQVHEPAYGTTPGQIGALKEGALALPCSICGTLTNGDESCQQIGRTTFAVQTGQKPGPSPSSETAGDAATAEQQRTCTSTTSKTPKQLAGNGTTGRKTSKRSAGPATPDDMPSPENTDSTNASSAEPKSGPEAGRLSSADQTNAANDTSETPSKPTEHESSAALLCAACAASQSNTDCEDTSTAPTTAQEPPKRRANKRPVDPNAQTYWSEMAKVYREVHKAMKPGAVMACVVKDYISGGKRVPLCDDTCTLLAHLGFDVFERTRAMLVKRDEHPGLFDEGEAVVKEVSRKSFFRRLAEKKGSPRIDHEEVLWAKRC
jgi:hypothetical protein